MTRRVLMIAYHFPPLSGSSGIQRTLKFCRYLGEHGWQPTVLTISPIAYESTSDDLLAEIPDDIDVLRVFGLDAARHFAVAGKYPKILSIPDRWSSWSITGSVRGYMALRRNRFDAIWSTYPIATAHLIGLWLQRFSGLPWVADFRDSMVDATHPAPGMRRRAYGWIEKKSVHSAARIVLTAPGTVEMYRSRFPEIPQSRFVLLRNGYDEENFLSAEQGLQGRQPASRKRLVHSGTLYPSERDPIPFLDALADLRRQGLVSSSNLSIVFRATGHDDYLRPLLEERELGDIVSLAPAIPYRDALIEMLEADGLLIFQAANSDHQIPAKLYEYLRAGRPILCVANPNGDTASTLRSSGVDSIVDIADWHDIARGLRLFLGDLQNDTPRLPNPEFVQQCSRRSQTRELAEILDQVAENRATAPS